MSNSSVKLFSKLDTSRIIEGKQPPIIITDKLRTPENMGLILRLAANIGAINTYFIVDYDKKFRHSKIVKTASGAASKVDWKIINQEELLSYIPDDYKIIALETSEDSVNLFSFVFPEKTAFLVGNEVRGISSEIIAQAHHKVYIPVPGPISSLNVTHALSIGLFEWLRQNLL